MAATVLSPTRMNTLDTAAPHAMANPLELETRDFAPSPSKKRKSAEPPQTDDDSRAPRAKKRASPEDKAVSEDAKMCHQCHQKRDDFLSCTRMKQRGKQTRIDQCKTTFCKSCLSRRYDQDSEAIRAAGRPSDPTKCLGHAPTQPYIWKCPVCDRDCNCSVHRKEYGLPLTGLLEKHAANAGLSFHQLLHNKEALDKALKAKEDQRVANSKPANGTNVKPANGTNGTNGRRGTDADNGAKAVEQKAPKAKAKPAPKSKVDAKKNGTSKAIVKLPPPPPAYSRPLTTAPIPPPMLSNSIVKIPALPKPSVKKPKAVPAPNFEFIAISYSLTVIQNRLRFREFVLRFEKLLSIPKKYIRIINDPNSSWTDLTYKNLITAQLAIMQSDEDPKIHPDHVYETAEAVRKTNIDGNPDRIWKELKKMLGEIYDLEAVDLEDTTREEIKLELLTYLMEFTVGSSIFRRQIEKDLAKEKALVKETHEEIKKLKAGWEERKQVFNKEKLQLPQSANARTEFQTRYANALAANKNLIQLAEAREWHATRKLGPRYTPLGKDVLGNCYHLFTCREQSEEDWGHWVVIEKEDGAVHPSGTIPPPPLKEENSEGEDEEGEEVEPDSPETIASRTWYALSTSSELQQLADWIQFRFDDSVYQATAPPTPSLNGKKFAVSVPNSRRGSLVARGEEPAVERAEVEALVREVRKIAGFFRLREEGVGKV